MPIKITKLNPKYIVILTITIVILMVASAYYEITSSRKEIFNLLEEEAISLVKTISASSKNAILSGNEIEVQVNKNLDIISTVITNNSGIINLRSPEIQKLLKKNNTEIALITDVYGNILQSNRSINSELQNQIKNYIINNSIPTDTTLPGFIIQDHDMEIYFAANKTISKNRFVFAGIDTKYFLDFRKKIGIGTLFRNLTNQKEIEYVVLQDSDGILAASRNITELSSIDSDSFLVNVIKKDTIATRTFQFNDFNIFEAVMPLRIESDFFGIVRAGLSMESVSLANERMFKRIIIMAIIIAGIGVVLLSLLLINQHKNTLHNELKKLQSYNETILENMADGVIAIDNNGTLLFINSSAENILGITSYNVIGRKTGEIFKNNKLYNIISGGKEIKSIEIPISEPIEKTVRISISFAKKEEGQNDILSIILLQDITEERKLQKQLQINEKMAAMGELAGGVAHEVRNPLNSISIITQRLALEFEPKEDKEDYSKLIKTIREEISRINNIVEQFLRFARRPKIILHKETVAVIILKAIDLMKAETDNKNIKIDSRLDNSIISEIDRDQFMQAIINILKNSVQAIEQNGIIKISLKRLPEEFLLEINDTGKGIEKSNLSKIFNLYYSTKPDGTGIGLSIVNQIISEHNGRIEVESESGQGATFKIFFKYS